MDSKLYQEQYNLETSHWWFIGRRRVIFDFIKNAIPSKVGRALDIGCGTGLNASLLKEYAEDVQGLEMSDEIIRFSQKRAPDITVHKGKFPEEIPLSGGFDLVTLFDVLEHCDDDIAALTKIHTILNPNGYLVISVPAFSFLWSQHDELAHHKRRYTKTMLKKKLQDAGFSVQCITYFNTILFPAIFMARFIRNMLGLRKGLTDFFTVSPLLNNLLSFIFGSERFFLRFINFPFGVSLIAIAKKV